MLHITLEEIAVGFDTGKFTVVDLVNTYLARIREVNDELHAVIETNPDAVAIAKRLDEEMKQSGRRG
jgi:amidase